MFYVGQKVVAIKDSKKCFFKKNQEFVVIDIIQCECGKKYISVGIVFGVPKWNQNSFCPECKKVHDVKDFRYHDSGYFAPLEEYRESYSIAIQLVQEMEQVDKQKVFNPKKETVKN